MANELVLNLTLKFSRDGVEREQSVANLKVDVSDATLMDHVQTISTSEEALTLGDVTAGGWMFAKNLDSTNFVEIRGATSDTSTVKLKAGEFACFRLSDSATAPYAIADTAAVKLLYLLLSD